jgi:hypothetical protein
MNIAQTNIDANNNATQAQTTTVYINIDSTKLANDINDDTLTHQFDGKGNTVTALAASDEATYLYYSSDQAGQQVITPPFSINQNDYISFNLQTQADKSNAAVYKFKGIVQNEFDLQVTSTKNTFKGIKTTEASDADQVTIRMRFTLNNQKYNVAWDPKIKVIS